MSTQKNQSSTQSQYLMTQYHTQSIQEYFQEHMTVDQSLQPMPTIYQDIQYLFHTANSQYDRINQLEIELHEKKRKEQSIIPDQIISTPNGMCVCLGSTSKFIHVSNFNFIEASVMVFPEPIEKEDYYWLKLSLDLFGN